MPQEFVFINLYRAVAAFWVLLAHCMIWGGWEAIPLPSAKIAVDLFMVISGFLMAANNHARSALEPLTSARNCIRFWMRRYFRIAPAYYLSLFVAVIASEWFLGGYVELQAMNPDRWVNNLTYDPKRIEYTFGNLIAHVTFIFGLHPKWSFSTMLPDWSLSLEMQFYLIFPLILYVLRKYGGVRSSIIASVGVVSFAFLLSKFVGFREPSFILLKLNYFLGGIILFSWLVAPSGKKNPLMFCALIVVSLDFRYGFEVLVQPVLMMTMMLLARQESNQGGSCLVRRVAGSRLIKYASDTSFGVYLFHGFFLSATGLIIASVPELKVISPRDRFFAIFIFVLVSSYTFAWFVYRWVELPGINFGKRFIAKKFPAVR